MNKEVIGSAVGTSITTIGTATQTNEILQRISLILTIVGTLITIIMALVNWWKNAKKDGKIDDGEKEEGKNIFKKLLDAIKALFSIFKKKDKEDDDK